MTAAQQESTRSGLSAQERRNLTLLLIGETTSTGGTQITAIALPLLLVQSFRISALTLSLFAAARYLPYIFLGVPLGMYADSRKNLRRTMLIADASRLFAIALIPILWSLNMLSIPLLFGIVLVVAAIRVVYDLCSSVFVVRNFYRTSWLIANSRLDTLFSTMECAGPSIAGTVASTLGAAWAFLFDAFSYAVSFACVRRLQERPGTALNAPDLGAPARDVEVPNRQNTARFLFTHPILRLIAAATSAQNAALMTLQGVAILILVHVRHMPAYAAGLVIAGMGAGGALGAFLAPRLITRFGLAPVASTSAIVTALAPLLLFFHGPPYVWLAYCCAYVLLGAGVALTSVSTRRYRQEAIPAESFARVQGLYGSLLMGSLPLGSLLGGALFEWFTPLAAVVGSSALFFIAAALLLAARSEGRTVRMVIEQ